MLVRARAHARAAESVQNKRAINRNGWLWVESFALFVCESNPDYKFLNKSRNKRKCRNSCMIVLFCFTMLLSLNCVF